jgi:heme O synthase-like polyprenyltransferase
MVAYPREESVGTPVVLGSPANPTLPGWVSASVLPGALLRAAGGIMRWIRPAMLVSADAEIRDQRMRRARDRRMQRSEINGAVRVYAGCLVALATMLLVMLARGVLSSLIVLTACIERINAGMDWMERWNDGTTLGDCARGSHFRHRVLSGRGRAQR